MTNKLPITYFKATNEYNIASTCMEHENISFDEAKQLDENIKPVEVVPDAIVSEPYAVSKTPFGRSIEGVPIHCPSCVCFTTEMHPDMAKIKLGE